MRELPEGSISFAEAAKRYLAWREQLFSANTVKNDRVAIRRFEKAVGEGWYLDEITPDIGSASLQYVRGTVAPTTANQYYSQMQGFWRWCIDEELVPLNFNPFRNQGYLKIQKKEYERLHRHEFRAFIEAIRRPEDRILCSVGLYLCVRANEVCRMRLKDVKLEAGWADVIISKSYDADTMPIPNELDADLRQWLTHYTSMVGPLDPEMFLVPSPESNGHYMKYHPYRSPKKPERTVHRAADDYGIELPKGQGAHFLRRSGARAWFDDLCEQGVDGALRTVSAHLHHADTKTTEGYLGVSGDRAKRNQLLHRRTMFPSTETGNVVYLQEAK